MEIKVLGTGCAGCKELHETVKQAVAEFDINEKVVSAGKKLSISNVKTFLTK